MINPFREAPKVNAPHARDKATIQRLAMYQVRSSSSGPRVRRSNAHVISCMPVYQAFDLSHQERTLRDKDGKIIGGKYMSKTPLVKVARIEPNRKWFGMPSSMM
jgi:hypothetical protein